VHHHEPELTVHGRGTARDGVRPRDPRHSVDDVDRHRPEGIDPVSHAGGRHGVGDQRDPVGSDRAHDVPVDRRVDMHTVGDDFDGDPGVFEQRDDGTGLATVDRTHGVEQVGAHGRARCDRRPRLLVGRLGVADGRDRPSIDDLTDRLERAVAFRCEGDHPDRPGTRAENVADFTGVRVAHQRRLVRAAAPDRQPWTFQMDSVDHTRAHVIGQFPDLA